MQVSNQLFLMLGRWFSSDIAIVIYSAQLIMNKLYLK